MNAFGEKIKQLRTERALPLRKIAAQLDIDQSVLSKIERGERKAQREHLEKLSNIFDMPAQPLIVNYLSDAIVRLLAEEEVWREALKTAEEKIAALKKEQAGENAILIKDKVERETVYFFQEKPIDKVYFFGSHAQQPSKASPDSALNIMITLEKTSMHNAMGWKIELQRLLGRKIDLVVEQEVSPYVKSFIDKSKRLIYSKDANPVFVER